MGFHVIFTKYFKFPPLAFRRCMRLSCQVLDSSQDRLALILARFPRKALRNAHESLAKYISKGSSEDTVLTAEKSFKFSGPYCRTGPAKLTNRSARTKRYHTYRAFLAFYRNYRSLQQDGCHHRQLGIWTIVGIFHKYQSIFRHKRPVNLESVYTKFNLFALIYWKGMKLGGYDRHICTNRFWHRVNLSLIHDS